eukprot:symbB.v1.2.010052.t3/scaffold636.1/size252712/7
MRLLSGLLTLSSSVPGAIGPSFAEDVYGLNQFEHSKVQCPATTPCVTWVYPPWADETIDCAAAKRGCGLRELVEERPVECKDQRSQIILPDNECTGIKPSSRRVICPSTPECKGTETLTTTLASTAVTTAVTTAPPATTMQAAKVGSWVAPAWSKPDCSQRCCGLGELKEERAVLCMDCNGQLLPECSCAGWLSLMLMDENRVCMPAMHPRLELGNVAVDDFETYKHHPALLQSTSVLPLDVDAEVETFEVMSALEAEAEARSDAGKLLLLFDDTLAVTYHGSQVMTRWLNDCTNGSGDGGCLCFRCPVVSMVLASSDATVSHVILSLAATTAASHCAVIVLRIASNGLPQVIHETWMTGKRLFLCAAGEGSDGKVVNVLAYRIVRSTNSLASHASSHVEVVAAQMDLGELSLSPEAKILWTAHGPHPPQAAHWGNEEILPEYPRPPSQGAQHSQELCLVSRGGFELDGSEASNSLLLETEDPVLTVWKQNSLECWPLPRGELLSSWASKDGIHVVLADPTSAANLAVLRPSTTPLCVVASLPGAAACATARRLRDFVVAPNHAFFALLDMDQQNVSIFRTPQGDLVSPMATLPPDHGAVHAMVATAGAVVVRTRTSIVKCTLNLSSRKRRLISPEQMPLGMDPKALLKMLDARGPKPLTSTVLCPATSPCGSPLATTALATTSTMSTTAAPTSTAPVTTTTQASPSPVWVYTAWMTDKSNCEARSCGQGALMQERPVVCQDLASGVKLMDSKCSGSKPPTTRVLCPATAACSVVSSTTTTTAACCPKGYSLKPPEELPLSCKQGSCEVQNCCSPVSWFHEDWDETQECNASCGLPEQLQERSVTCQATDGGEVSKDEECRGVRMPARQRTLCPATQPCTSCSGFICSDESFPIVPPPACPNGKCDSQRCCAEFLSGFHTKPGLKAMAVTNEGRRGHFFQLNGETSMNLLTPSVHNGLTAFIYLRPHAEGWVDKEQVVLVNKGLAGATWKLVLTPMKQFRIWNFKAERPSSCTCTTVHEDLWSHIMVKDNATAMELAVNGKVCCATKSGIAPVNSGGYSIWLEEGLQADLHAVQVWDSALNEQHVAHVTRRYHKAIPDWLPLQHLSCLHDAVQFLTGISSLAHCKLRCEEHEMCQSVLFDIARSRCVLRSRFACASCGCTRNVQSLTANYDGGCRKNGAFDWRLSVTLEEKTVRVTELAFLDDEQHQINADVMSDDNFTKLPASCALNDWKTVGPGCAIPHGSGFWEYRFKKCVNPTYLVMAVKEGDLPENFPVKIRYSTATGEWKECVALPVLWITSDHSESALRRFHLSCFGSAPLAESPWWHH